MIVLKNGLVLQNNQLVSKDIVIQGNKILQIADFIDKSGIDCTGKLIFPGAIDVHVHLREPGYEYKETIKTGCMAAAKGGVTTIMAMPNLNPVPDSLENLEIQKQIIDRDAIVHVYPYAAFTKGQKGLELADIDAIASKVKAITDDGVGVNNLPLLYKGMELAKKYNLVIASHAEDSLFKYQPRGEYEAVRREIIYANEIGCKYHFCHMSTKESFAAIKKAKLQGNFITCEVSPHHLFLNEEMIGGNPDFKMNPPLRSVEDQNATLEALLDGTADMIATDHAPHSKEEKSGPYEKCPNGIIGLETLIPLVYTNLVKKGKATVGQMQQWLVENPSKIFDLPCNKIAENEYANLCVIDIENEHTYCQEEIVSKSSNSPYIGMSLFGWPVLTICDGKIVYKREELL